MKDTKFNIFLALVAGWVILLILSLFGEKINPKVERILALVAIVWFAYWTISILFKKPNTDSNTDKTNKNTDNTDKNK